MFSKDGNNLNLRRYFAGRRRRVNESQRLPGLVFCTTGMGKFVSLSDTGPSYGFLLEKLSHSSSRRTGNSPGAALWADEEPEKSHKRRGLARSHLKSCRSKDSGTTGELGKHEQGI